MKNNWTTFSLKDKESWNKQDILNYVRTWTFDHKQELKERMLENIDIDTDEPYTLIHKYWVDFIKEILGVTE